MLARCPDCQKPIIISDDDAGVCIQCGGLNRQWRPPHPDSMGKTYADAVDIAIAAVACTTLVGVFVLGYVVGAYT